MRYDLSDPWNAAADRLVLSEGHAVPVVYAAYADLNGVVGNCPCSARQLKVQDVETLRQIDSCLDGHPNPAEGFPFFDAATGSLGQGLSVGAGLGLAAKLGGIDKLIYVVCGDGESREGQLWEAADLIIDGKLTNVITIINCNGQGQAGYVSKQQSQAVLKAKLTAYGFQVEMPDGHDVDQLCAAFDKSGKTDKPLAILAATTKGWGVENLKSHTNHGKPVPADQMAESFASLDAMRKTLNVPDCVNVSSLKPKAPAASASRPAGPTAKLGDPDIAALLAGDGFLEKFQSNGKIATRRAYGLALRELARGDGRVVALDGDVSNSTFADYLAKEMPDRFFECKIAEQNMISAAAGFAAAGYVPFVSSFGKFLVRGYDQIEMALISRANIKFVGSHIGVTLAADGPSQMGLVDLPFFRAMSSAEENGQPAMVIFNPADAVCAYKSVQIAADRQGMCYIRTMRPDTKLIYKPSETFEIGGSKVLLDGKDLTIVATGYMTHVALEAAEALKQQGLNATVVDAYCFPLNADPIIAAAEKGGNKILTVEDNYTGGLFSNVAEIASSTGKIKVKGMYVKRIPKSGITPDDLLKYCGLTADDVVAAAKDL